MCVHACLFREKVYTDGRMIIDVILGDFFYIEGDASEILKLPKHLDGLDGFLFPHVLETIPVQMVENDFLLIEINYANYYDRNKTCQVRLCIKCCDYESLTRKITQALSFKGEKAEELIIIPSSYACCPSIQGKECQKAQDLDIKNFFQYTSSKKRK